MNDPVLEKTCEWKHTPNATPWTHPRFGPQPGFPDEWKVGCCPAGTLRIEPRPSWNLCPYCGLQIKWLTDPNDPSLPRDIPRVV